MHDIAGKLLVLIITKTIRDVAYPPVAKDYFTKNVRLAWESAQLIETSYANGFRY